MCVLEDQAQEVISYVKTRRSVKTELHLVTVRSLGTWKRPLSGVETEGNQRRNDDDEYRQFWEELSYQGESHLAGK